MYCPNCGREVAESDVKCPSCGHLLKTTAMPVVVLKSPGKAAILAFLPGLVGIWGLGHLYLGRFLKGLAILAVGIVLAIMGTIIAPGAFMGFIASTFGGPGRELAGAGMLIFVVGTIGFFWQVYDAYKLAKKFNAHVMQHGVPPW